MRCRGKFKYKGLEKKEGGKFVNSQGQEVNYKPSYRLYLDELVDGRYHERQFKIPLDSEIVKALENIKLLQEIEIEFDVKLYQNQCLVIPEMLVK